MRFPPALRALNHRDYRLFWLRGRVMGLYTMVFAGVTPVGAFLIGSIAEGAGVPAACGAAGGLALIAVLLQVARWRRAQDLFA